LGRENGLGQQLARARHLAVPLDREQQERDVVRELRHDLEARAARAAPSGSVSVQTAMARMPGGGRPAATAAAIATRSAQMPRP
jgi:hypothetical protein